MVGTVGLGGSRKGSGIVNGAFHQIGCWEGQFSRSWEEGEGDVRVAMADLAKGEKETASGRAKERLVDSRVGGGERGGSGFRV